MIEVGDIRLDTKKRTVFALDEEIVLTRKEMGILEYLMVNAGEVVSPEELMEHVWDKNADLFSNSIRVHISSMRKKIRAKLEYDPIENVVGQGYVMRDKDR